VNAFETTLKAAKVTHELFRYDAAHGFFNEQRTDVYHADASKQSWERMHGFLAKHL
jgi:dienelactone hydrolase